LFKCTDIKIEYFQINKLPSQNTLRLIRLVLLLFGLFFTHFPNISQAAEVNFDRVFLGVANNYTKNSNSITVKSPLPGSSFKFISSNHENPVFHEGTNGIEGKLQYVDPYGNTVTIFGVISRKSSQGSTTQSFYFGVLSDSGNYTGLAYQLIMNPYMYSFPGDQIIETNTDEVKDALNAYLFRQSKTIILSSDSGTVSETGTTCLFSVVLSSQPDSNDVVVLDISADKTTEASVSPKFLTFTKLNWNTPQIVTLTGLDDSELDGAQTTIFTIAANKSGTTDKKFINAASKIYKLITLDDEEPITISGLGALMSSDQAAISVEENKKEVIVYSASRPVKWSISGTDAYLLEIDDSGKIFFEIAPDYENPRDKSKSNTYFIEVIGTDTLNLSVRQKLCISITDLDDTAPDIIGYGGSVAPLNPDLRISVVENKIALFKYTSNKSVTWFINGTDASSFIIGTDGMLVFKSSPDYELPSDANQDNIYEIIISAVDSSRNKTSQNLYVEIVDTDDTLPIILGPGGALAPSTLEASILLTGDSLKVFDYSSNETVNWAISGIDSHLFTIGTEGRLAFKVKPDYKAFSDNNERDITFTLFVKAIDLAGNETSQKLTITRTDDTPPAINGPIESFVSNTGEAFLSISENSDHAFAFSSDQFIEWSLAGTDASFFSINTNGKLTANTSFDYELPLDADKNNYYSIVVKAVNSRGNESTKDLTIIVTNVNEAPENILLSTSVIYENNSINRIIGYLESVDIDQGDTFKYSIVGGDTESFLIAGNKLKAKENFVFLTKSTYKLIIRSTDQGGLSFEKSFDINIIKSPSLVVESNLSKINQSIVSDGSVSMSKGFKINLNVTGPDIISYNWSPSKGLSAANISNPTVNPNETTTYTVSIINAQGISTELSVRVVVLEDYNITPNNVISPDGDGVNDTWVVENISAYPNNEVKIYDKGGREIYKAKNYNNDWYGQVNGNRLNAGVYYYVINLGVGAKTRVGYINLIVN
jgi:gliding motility-associated-like protein